MAASGFWKALDRLGLSQYHDRLLLEAFDSWEILADITEEDFDALDMKLGHRRILQRATTEFHRRRPQSLAVAIPPVRSKQRTPDSPRSVTSRDPSPDRNRSGKRWPLMSTQPDQNAPKRPLSAYVLFSNQTRDSLKGQDLSFTKIAKTVGERWQVLLFEEKEIYESRARMMKYRYHTQLAEYEGTKDHVDYQEYLVDFHVKYDHQLSTQKRIKDDYKSSPHRRRNHERVVGSPDGTEGSANHSEQSSGDTHLSDFRPPELLTRVNRPLSIQPGNVLPSIAPSMPSPLKETGLLASSNQAAGSSLGFCLPNESVTTFSHGVSHQDWSPVPSRPVHFKQSLPTMRVLGPLNQKSILPSGLEALLRVGEKSAFAGAGPSSLDPDLQIYHDHRSSR